MIYLKVQAHHECEKCRQISKISTRMYAISDQEFRHRDVLQNNLVHIVDETIEHMKTTNLIDDCYRCPMCREPLRNMQVVHGGKP